MVIVVPPSFPQYNYFEQTSDCRKQNAKNEKGTTNDFILYDWIAYQPPAADTALVPTERAKKKSLQANQLQDVTWG